MIKFKPILNFNFCKLDAPGGYQLNGIREAQQEQPYEPDAKARRKS